MCVCIYDSREAATVITLFLFFAGVSVSVFYLQRFLYFEVVTDLIGLAGKARRVYA